MEHFIKGKKMFHGICLLVISAAMLPMVIIGNKLVEVPLVEGTTCNEAYFMLEQRGLKGTPIITENQVVVSQIPQAGQLVLKGDNVKLEFATYKYDLTVEYVVESEEEKWKAKYELYSKEQDDAYSQINAGYILVNHLMGEENRDDEAIELYKSANCVEADRNLFALLLKREETDLAEEIAYKLLYIYDDDATWNYISNCLFNMSWDDYCIEYKQSKENFNFDVIKMFELEDTNQEYRGYNPPTDPTENSVWVSVGVDFEENHPYTIWHFYRSRFMKEIMNYEMMYEE